MEISADSDAIKKKYTFNEAIELTGTGLYNVGLLLTLSLTLLAMVVDMFGFSVVVPLCACDFHLNMIQKSFLVSTPFIGPVVTSYFWGYVSDTRGRRLSLLIGLSGCFIFSILCAFSSHWVVLAVFKLIGTCFCSCAQSATFALLGESCPEKSKGKYLLIMSSVVHLGLLCNFVLSFLIGHLTFSYNLGFITFVPWRLLVLALALPSGLSVICLLFFYESPKFLLNAGREDLALEVLRRIFKRNGKYSEVYPVVNIVLDEEGNINRKDTTLLQSLQEQTVPLFKPPLLSSTVLLYFLILVSYSASGGFYIWLPFIAKAFTGGTEEDFSHGLCGMIVQSNTIGNSSASSDCSAVDFPMVIAAFISGFTYSFLNVIMSKFAHRKRALMVAILLLASVSCFLITMIPNRGSGVAYFGVLSTSLAMGPIFSYYVDLYPTSFRGMAACLGVMMSRISSVAGVNLLGPFITTHCNLTFYAMSAFLFSGVVMTYFLPPDKPNKPTF